MLAINVPGKLLKRCRKYLIDFFQISFDYERKLYNFLINNILKLFRNKGSNTNMFSAFINEVYNFFINPISFVNTINDHSN